MSWQVEQLKEELSSKEAQGEELKKRAAGLQAEVFAVRFTLLCAVIPQWDPASSGFWVAYTFHFLWLAALPSTGTNQPALLFNQLLFSSLNHMSLVCSELSHVLEVLYLVLYCPIVTVWMVLQRLFILSSFLVTRDLLVYIDGSLFFFLGYIQMF